MKKAKIRLKRPNNLGSTLSASSPSNPTITSILSRHAYNSPKKAAPLSSSDEDLQEPLQSTNRISEKLAQYEMAAKTIGQVKKTTSKTAASNPISDFMQKKRGPDEGNISDDFETPKKINLPVVKKKIVPTRKRGRKQTDIRTLLKKNHNDEHLAMNDFMVRQSTKEGMNPEDLQMALALSKSMLEQKMDNSATTTAPADDKLTGIRRTLEQYGFKCKNSYENFDFTNVIGSNAWRSFKRGGKLTLLMRQTKEKREVLVKKKVARISGEQPEEDMHEDERGTYRVWSAYLEGIVGKEETILPQNSIEEESSLVLSRYYSGDLFPPSTTRAGYLLKKWETIPGREDFDDSLIAAKQQKEDDAKLETTLEDVPKSQEADNTSTIQEKLDKIDERKTDLSRSCEDLFASCDEMDEEIISYADSASDEVKTGNQDVIEILSSSTNPNSNDSKSLPSVNEEEKKNEIQPLECSQIDPKPEILDLTQNSSSDDEEALESAPNASQQSEKIAISDEEINYSMKGVVKSGIDYDFDFGDESKEESRLDDNPEVTLIYYQPSKCEERAKSVTPDPSDDDNEVNQSLAHILNDSQLLHMSFKLKEKIISPQNQPKTFFRRFKSDSILNSTTVNVGSVSPPQFVLSDSEDDEMAEKPRESLSQGPSKAESYDELDRLIFGSPFMPPPPLPSATPLSQRRSLPAVDKISPKSSPRKAKPSISFKNRFSDFAEPLQDAEFIVKTRDVTPPPNFRLMNTIQLERECGKYCLKQIRNRENCVRILEHIYCQTHPFVEIDKGGNISLETTRVEAPPSLQPKDRVIQSLEEKYGVASGNGRAGAKRKRKTPQKAEKVKRVNVKPTTSRVLLTDEVEGSVIVDEKMDWSAFDDEEVVLPVRPRGKLQWCPMPLHLAFHNLLRANSDLHRKILSYWPIELERIYKFFKLVDVRYELNDIIAFLDRKCITFRSETGSGSRLRRVASSQ